jgi:transposase
MGTDSTPAAPAQAQALALPRPEARERPSGPTGILFVLKSGIPWEMLLQEMGCGSGMTCWRRLRDWQEAGVWQRLHELLLAQLQEADQIDWSRAVVDSASVRALGGGGKNRTQSHRPTQAG